MPTRARIRRTLDFGRLRDALAGPGADPRSWLEVCRVEDTDDALRWEEGYGWVVDVTIVSGELGEEKSIPCRISSTLGGNERLASDPIKLGSEAIVLFPSGDPNVSPIVVGFIHNFEDQKVPETVNGETIDEAFAEANHIFVSPDNVQVEVGEKITVSSTDEINASTKNVQVDADEDIELNATQEARLLGQNVKLADANATQAFVKGTDQFTALQDVLIAIGTFATALGSPPFPPGPVIKADAAAAAVTLNLQIVSAITNLQNALSTRIKGE